MNDRLMERRTLDVRGIQVRDAEDGDGSILTGIAVPFNTRTPYGATTPRCSTRTPTSARATA